jgi:hypothetical protein
VSSRTARAIQRNPVSKKKKKKIKEHLKVDLVSGMLAKMCAVSGIALALFILPCTPP